MDMASCSRTGETNVSYDISSLDTLPHLYRILPIVGIIGGKIMTVGDHNNITSASVPTRKKQQHHLPSPLWVYLWSWKYQDPGETHNILKLD